MQNLSKLEGLIGLARKAGKLTIGSDASREALVRDRVHLMILAEDVSPGSGRKIEGMAKDRGIPVIRFSSKSVLGNLLGREKVAVLGILEESFAKGLIDQYQKTTSAGR